MFILKQQKGMSAVGWLLLLALIIVIVIPGRKIIPIYINDLKITIALNNLSSDLGAQAGMTSPEKIKSDLLKRFELQHMPEITADEITVTQSLNNYHVRITHQYREKIIEDKYFTLSIDKSVDMPIIIKH
jgi:hypothetical protein